MLADKRGQIAQDIYTYSACYLFTYLLICLFMYLSMYLLIQLFTYLVFVFTYFDMSCFVEKNMTSECHVWF